MNARQAHRQRQQAARERQAALRRRARRRRVAVVAVLALALVAGIGAWAVTAAGHDHPAATPAAPGSLPGLQTGPAPWSTDTAGLAGRLQAIGVPPLSPMEGTVIHIHQHLDLYVDGRKVTVPAGIGIDPAVGYAPLHTHDPSGVVHVESPVVRTYTLGELFAVWGSGSPPAASAATAPAAAASCGST